MKLTQERLKDLLDYDSNTGLFTWRVYRARGAKIGQTAGSYSDTGYIDIRVDGRLYRAHRLAWLYLHGYFPENDIDHIDRVKINNKASNLRVVSKSCNSRNTGIRVTNTSGIKGVSWLNSRQRWYPQITVNGKPIYLGIFKDKTEAVIARWEAEKKYGFHGCCTDSTAFLYLKGRALI